MAEVYYLNQFRGVINQNALAKQSPSFNRTSLLLDSEVELITTTIMLAIGYDGLTSIPETEEQVITNSMLYNILDLLSLQYTLDFEELLYVYFDNIHLLERN